MRVVLFGPAYPFRGGVPLFTTTLALKLRQAGHQADVVNFRALFPQVLFRGRSQADDSPAAIRVDSERTFVAWQPGTWSETAATIADKRPDLILAQWWQPLFAPGYCGVLRALPPPLRHRWFHVIHDVVSHDRWPGDRMFSRWGLRCAERYLCLSRFEAQQLKRLLPRAAHAGVHIAHHPVYDNQSFSGSLAEARRQLGITANRVLLFFGFVRRYKGLDILLRAMPEIVTELPDTQLLVAGPFHDSRSRYDRLLEKLRLGSSVVVHDRYFSGEEASACFAVADVVILPYRSATQTGVVPMAEALGVPAIVTEVGALGEAVQNEVSGFVIPPDDPHALADAVRRFYAAGGRVSFAPALMAAAGQHSWESFILKLEEICVRA